MSSIYSCSSDICNQQDQADLTSGQLSGCVHFRPVWYFVREVSEGEELQSQGLRLWEEGRGREHHSLYSYLGEVE